MFKPYILLIVLLNLPFISNAATKTKTETAILAGGCFWCVESDFEKLDGVVEVISGYIGGHLENPTYKLVSSGTSGHIEAAEIIYNPDKINYSQILDFFWRHIDPTNNKGQFCDYGPQYRPAIFFRDEQQQQLAAESLKQIEQTKPFADPIRVELIPASRFYPAEDYHQDYYKKSSVRYRYYRFACGRDARIEELWGQH